MAFPNNVKFLVFFFIVLGFGIAVVATLDSAFAFHCFPDDCVHRDHFFYREGTFKTFTSPHADHAAMGWSGPPGGGEPAAYDNIFLEDLPEGEYRIQVLGEYAAQSDEHLVLESSSGDMDRINDLNGPGCPEGAQCWGEAQVDVCTGGGSPANGSVHIRAWSQVPPAMGSLPVFEVRVQRVGSGSCPGAAPNAAIECVNGTTGVPLSPCETWKQGTSFSPIIRLNNNSSGDIANSIWTAISPPPPAVWGSCPGACNHTVQLHPAGPYTIELEVESSAGDRDTDTIGVTIKQDIQADFDCSVNGSLWQDCGTISVFAGSPVYFRAVDGTNLSIPSEGATIDDWSWNFVFSVPPGGGASPPSLSCIGAAPNTCTNTFNSGNPVTFDTSGQYTVQLCIVDDQSRSHCVEKDLQAALPFPQWQEISPL